MASPLLILCFGDSLTVGHCQGGRKLAPYSDHLSLALNRHLCDPTAEDSAPIVLCETVGFSGWTALKV